MLQELALRKLTLLDYALEADRGDVSDFPVQQPPAKAQRMELRMSSCNSPHSRASPCRPTSCTGTWRLKRVKTRRVGARPVHSHQIKQGRMYGKRVFKRRSGGLTPGTLRKRKVG
eukprot:2533606-Alexandrium_andersonii.AAC.1